MAADTVDTVRDGNSITSRIRCRAWSITWFDYPEGYSLIFDTATHHYVGQIEECPKTKRLHIQAAVLFKNAVGPKHVQECFPGSHHEPAKSWKHLKQYCCKKETRAGETFTNIKKVRDIADPLANKTLFAWQTELVDLVSRYATEDEGRRIHWLWEPTGCAGKTSLAKHLCLKYKGEIIYVSGKAADAKYAVTVSIDKGADLRAIIYGLPRNTEPDYRALEELSDAIFFSPKYESCQVMYAPLHVIVFANTPPNTDALSTDRWMIQKIEPPEELAPPPHTGREVSGAAPQ